MTTIVRPLCRLRHFVVFTGPLPAAVIKYNLEYTTVIDDHPLPPCGWIVNHSQWGPTPLNSKWGGGGEQSYPNSVQLARK